MGLKQFLKFFMDSESNVDYVIIKSDKGVLFNFEGAKGNQADRKGLRIDLKTLLREEEADNLNIIYAGIEDNTLFVRVE